jgi:hypothetical protein
MTAAAFLADLRAQGVLLTLGASDAGQTVRWRADPGVVTPEMVAELRTHKAELIALLDAEAADDPDHGRRDAAIAIFDAEPDDEVDHRVIRCANCGFERNVEIVACPRCEPVIPVPSACLGPWLCPILGRCGRPTCVGPRGDSV